MLANRLAMVGSDSSAARIPLPGSTSFWAMALSDGMVEPLVDSTADRIGNAAAPLD
jgi:hypothetical protein